MSQTEDSVQRPCLTCVKNPNHAYFCQLGLLTTDVFACDHYEKEH